MRNVIERATFFLVFSSLAACGGGAGGGGVDIEIGECEGSGYRVAADTAADTGGGEPSDASFSVAVEGDHLVVTLSDTFANCCPSPGATFSDDGSTITLDFVDVTDDESCDCMCVTDFTVTSSAYPSGAYTVDVVYNGASMGTAEVVVP